MKYFLINSILFSLVLLLFSILSIFLPATPKATKSHLFAKSQKDSLLVYTNSPRIIFVGGSNIAFGINSNIVKSELNLNPINTGYNAGIGLTYMMENTIDKVKEGDIIVLAPEYQFFFGDELYGGLPLIITLLDVPNGFKTKLRTLNYMKLIKFFPEFVLSKYKITNYLIEPNLSKEIYGKQSFNEFGDSYRHWYLENEVGFHYQFLKNEFNSSAIDYILEFQEEINARGGHLLITFPGINSTSYTNLENEIDQVYNELLNNNFDVVGKPNDFVYSDSLKFNSPYHPNKKGSIIRTETLIKEIKYEYEIYIGNDESY